jgi:hypothetical protein
VAQDQPPFSKEAKIILDEGNQSTQEDLATIQKVYPYKAEEFGKLNLPENVIKAKLVTMNSGISAAMMNPHPFRDGRKSAGHSSTSGCTSQFQLFTLEETDYLTIYKIKAFNVNDSSSTISNFRMAKKCSVLLEYPVMSIEWIPYSQSSSIPFKTSGLS